MSSKARKKPSQRGGAGPVAFFVALFIVALGTIQLASTFHTYALNLAELNGLKKQELAYSFKQADRSDPVKADSTKQSQHAGEEDKQDSQQQTGQSQQDGQQPSEDGQE